MAARPAVGDRRAAIRGANAAGAGGLDAAPGRSLLNLHATCYLMPTNLMHPTPFGRLPSCRSGVQLRRKRN